MRFFTAVFGEGYRRPGLALVRSFRRYAPSDHLTVFTDLYGVFDGAELHDFGDLLGRYPTFYQQELGGRRNVFKYALFAEMQRRYPGETIAWIDADMLVFGGLAQHVVEGRVNVVAHGRRDGQVVPVGDGLVVPGARYVIGGLFALPPGPALPFLERVTAERPWWADDGGRNHKIGDQLILNHLVARGGQPVHWITDDRRFIFNLEIADGLHPGIGDERLRRMDWGRDGPVVDGRPVVVFCWIKRQLDLHLATDFDAFRPNVARRLRELYAVPRLEKEGR